MGLESYEAYSLMAYGTTIKVYDYRTARNRYKCGKHYTMKAYIWEMDINLHAFLGLALEM
jgi:hypothetical protein